MAYIISIIFILLLTIIFCIPVYLYFTNKKYTWNVYRDNILISVGNYSYMPSVGDEVYYYVMDKFGVTTNVLELGKVVRVARLEDIIFVYTEYIEQKH